ncbi:MAG: glycoside hydrolase family 38 C-terminal domain-containing protein [Clostridia bacterium]|nr:glycoside hydrolase family 38 C-terminal domain-containing protein [Clostridia bacterium]
MDNKDKQIQCHFISNTHWDREWRFSARRTQYMLGYMLDMLLDILDKYPEYRHFHLDSQTMPVQDYLEAYPEKKEKFKKYVSEGRIGIGPWFCLPDEFTVSGESLIRNLLLGHKIGKEMGGISKTGYSPFGWGQISQLPQIYAGFDIHFASFYRGVNEYTTPKSEFYWESPDGTRIYASRLGKRPRYNIWYIVQRPVYYNQQNENNRDMQWNDNNGIFKFVDQQNKQLDYQYAHPFYEYHKENIKPRAEQAVKEQDNDWTTPHRFWSLGHDSSCPDAREVEMIKDLNDALPDANVYHSSLKEMEQGIIDEFNEDSPVLYGEMRAPYTKGSVSAMMGWIISARTYIKQDNFNTETKLTNYAEPMAVFATLCGAPYQRNFIDLSYNYLLQNHGHDSIGACGRDVVYEDVVYRYRQSRELSLCVYERAFMDVAGDINLKDWSRDDAAIVIFNPAPFKRSEEVTLTIELPAEWKADSFKITDTDGEVLKYQILSTNSDSAQIIQNPNDVANVLHTNQYTIVLDVKDVPAFGYRTLKLQPLYHVRATTPKTMLKKPQVMENEYLRVSFNSNGTYNVLDKVTGKSYEGLGYFKDTGEIGNPWEHFVPECDETFTTLNENAKITLLHEGELEVAYKVELDWALPEGRSMDEKTRSKHLNPCKIVNIVTLKKGAKYLEVETTVDNQSEDHYLQVGFPTGIKSEFSYAQGQFDVVKRPVAKCDYSLYDEIPMTEQPMNSFVDVTDGKYGAALLNTGLKAYEAADDECGTVYLSLLRSFPLRICVTQDMQDYSKQDKGSQCIGINTFRYAFMPHSGDWEEGNVWGESERFNLTFGAVQLAPTAHGKNSLVHSFLELGTEKLNVSAIKQSEDGKGYVVRLFNPSDKTVKSTINLNGGIAPIKNPQSPVERQKAEFELPAYGTDKWSEVKLVSLEEKDVAPLTMAEDGSVEFEITGKKILTIEFVC